MACGKLAKTTDSRRIGLVGEYSIEYKASNSGAILNLRSLKYNNKGGN